MAKLLALDWDPHHLRVVIANHQPNRIKLEYAKSYHLSNEEGAASLGEQVSQILKDPMFKGLDVLTSVRRSDVELRTIAMPTVPADELPVVVRFQASREFSELADDWPIDYLPLKTDSDEIKVLAAAISPEKLKAYSSAIQKVDLKPTSLILRPTATASLVTELEAEDQAHVELCIEDLETQFEITVLRGQCPVLIRTLQGPSAGEERTACLTQEVRRTILAAQNQLDGDRIERIILFGQDADGEQAAALEQQLKLPVRVLDPLQHVFVSEQVAADALENRGQFAATIGLLLGAESEDSHLIDFLNPRKPPPPKSSRDRVVAATFCVLLAGLLGVGGFYYYLQQLDDKTLDLQRTLQRQKEAVEAADARVQDYAAVEQWLLGRVDWLKQLYQVSDKLPGPDEARFDRMTASLSSSSGNGQIILEGTADRQSTIAEIDEALRTDGRGVNSAGGEFDGRDEKLPWRFKHTISIETEAGKRIAASRASRGRRRLGR